ncbi:MAG: hypothetical protein A2X25_07165 [Chloroflexi bacterium GWB2_49_20]|nr:MAG: hypothetical protein A2X25_07165 [Chloroflexi bacterium GWB2_49_20]OGN77939.1 MAG: hypothetical protein A2X26_14970 [Chloroflexi bacterium GWC2_49_37]OGN84977.1 MAG: hypothetical protein A2X27_09670 [Chloroflexi bacterium GWD2_49_16]HBG74994.1 hypothetical protein [Anaerolineae bacterium]HCC79743.1 hypothetical protein [Anaerolineae bacterium]
MKRLTIILLSGLGILLAISALTPKPVNAGMEFQNTACGQALADAASDAGIVPDTVTWAYDQSDPWGCSVSYEWKVDEWSWSDVNLQIDRWYDFQSYSCDDSSGCEVTSFHEFPALLEEKYQRVLSFQWYVERGGAGYIFLVSKGTANRQTETSEIMELAEALWLAADPGLPWGDGSPGTDPDNQPGGNIPSVPGEQPGGNIPSIPGSQSGTKSLGPLATTPFVPLIGALIGTIIGWLVSVARTNWDALKKLFTSLFKADPVSTPTLLLPEDWEIWENDHVFAGPEEPLRGPDFKENRSVYISAQDAKETLLDFYSTEISPESKSRVQSASMTFLKDDAFKSSYKQAFGKEDKDFTSAFVSSNGEITVNEEQAINYTPVHELMHVASNPELGLMTNEALDEGFTEYFTKQITDSRKTIRSTHYEDIGSVDIVRQLARNHGEELLRRAYFSPGRPVVEELRRAVDQKLGPGAFNKVVELMARNEHINKRLALDLLRSQGIRR